LNFRKCFSSVALIAAAASFTMISAFAAPPVTPGPPPNAPVDFCKARPNSPLTIQAAVDRGCTDITVAAGTYYENVTIPAGDTVTITGTAGAVNTIVDGGGNGTVFANYGNLTLTGLTIQNGSSIAGGGIYNDYSGSLTLNNSIVTTNGAQYGGGIYNEGGSLTLNDSTVSGNVATEGGGIYNNGGTATLNNSTVSGNTAEFGGGGGIFYLNAYGSSLTLNNSTVSGNTPDDVFTL